MQITMEEDTATTTTALAPTERAAIALESSKTEQHLKTLAAKHASITVVKDKAGREQAHGAYMEVMRARTAVEKAAKNAREDANKFSKAVIAESARLVAIVEPEELRLKAARDAWDEEQARIKAEAEAKERARVLAITDRINAIKIYVGLANNCRTSERVADLQARLAEVDGEGFEEFTDEATKAIADATDHLASVHADRLAQEAEAARIKAEQEAEAARLKAEREEMARQRAEAEEAARVAAQAAAAERAKMEAELSAQRAAYQAEAKRLADEARAQADAAEAKVREAAEAMAAERAELERMRSEIEAKNKPAEPVESAAIPEPVTTDATAPQPAPVVILASTPSAIAIINAVADYWDTDTRTAARWITERAAEIETLKG